MSSKTIISQKSSDFRYVSGSINTIEKKISALLVIVSNIKSLTESEIEDTERFKKEGMDCKILLGDILNSMEFSINDLDVYYNYMCDILSELRGLSKYLDSKS